MAKLSKTKKSPVNKNKKNRKYELKELDEPNLYKDIFPYTEVSKVVFDHKILPLNQAEEIFITDTTFRDGQQARPPYTCLLYTSDAADE